MSRNRSRKKMMKNLKTLLTKKIVIISVSVAAGLILAAVIIFVLIKSSPAGEDAEDPFDLTIEAEKDTDDAGGSEEDEVTIMETASAETKVESTAATTILAKNDSTRNGYLGRCVFLGDSRTVAMVNFGLINDDAALAQIGISHPSFKNNTFINNAGKQYTLKSYLAAHQAPVIYIALGVNGINDPSEDHYKNSFIDLIDTVMSQAPNSNIVLMSIGPVNDNGAYKKTVQNSWIEKYNAFLLQTAEEKHIFYLNVSEILTADSGQVRSEYDAGDGLHYNGEGCRAILDYIVHHPVPGISDEGEYTVHYIKPNPKNTKVTMDDGSGIDASKLQELMNMMVETTPVPTPVPTATPTPEYTPEPTQTPTPEPTKTPTPTPKPTQEPTATPIPEPTKTPTPTPKPTATEDPTPDPTKAPTPTPEPTETPTPEPTETPTPEPTEEPSPEPSEEPEESSEND